MKKTAEFGKPYNPPSYDALQTKLLEEAKEDVKLKLQKRTEDSIRKFRATLSIDGWSSVTKSAIGELHACIFCRGAIFGIGGHKWVCKKRRVLGLYFGQIYIGGGST